jgi:hypothetical protein
MKTIWKSMIGVGAIAVIVAGATPALARHGHARHFGYGYGPFAYAGPMHYRHDLAPRNFPAPAMRPFLRWDPYGLRWDNAE